MIYDLDFLKTLLGLFSIVGATASGVTALLVDYKNKKTGKITKWGRFALYGLAISFLIGASNLWIDYIQKSRENRNATEAARINSEKTLQIVRDLSRALNPFKDVHLTFDISYPFDDPDLVTYKDRLDLGVRALVDALNQGKEIQGVSRKAWTDDGGVNEVALHTSSPLLPNSSEYLASEVFFRRGLFLKFFKTPIDPTTFDLFSSSSTPDMEMYLGDSPDKDKIEIEYDLKTKTIHFWGSDIQPKPETWHSSGQIISLLDLPGSQLLIQLEYDQAVTFFQDPPRPGIHLKRINLPDSIFFIMGVADRSSWVLRGQDFKMNKGPRGTANFSYLFPKTFEEMQHMKRF